jgi:hypothetical protein
MVTLNDLHILKGIVLGRGSAAKQFQQLLPVILLEARVNALVFL